MKISTLVLKTALMIIWGKCLFFIIKYNISCRYCRDFIFYHVEAVSPIPNLLRVFIMKDCWVLSNAFLYHLIRSYYFFSLFMWTVHWLVFPILNQYCLPEVNTTCSFFINIWFYLLIVHWKFGHIYCKRYWYIVFLCCDIYLALVLS